MRVITSKLVENELLYHKNSETRFYVKDKCRNLPFNKPINYWMEGYEIDFPIGNSPHELLQMWFYVKLSLKMQFFSILAILC